MKTKEEEKANKVDNVIPHNSDIPEDKKWNKKWESIYIAGGCNKMPTTKKNAHVRLIGEAYALLTEKAEDYGVSQKEIASEAIFLMFSKEVAQRECMGLIEEAKAEAIQEATLTFRKLKKMGRWTFILSVILGILLGMALSLIIGLFWGVL